MPDPRAPEATELSHAVRELTAAAKDLKTAAKSAHPKDPKGKELSPLVLTILGAIGTGVLAVWNSWSQAQQAQQLEEQKLRSTLILKAIEPSDPEERKKALAFYVDTGLLDDPKGKIKAIDAENIPKAPNSTAPTWKRIGYSDIRIIDGAIVYASGLTIDPAGAYRSYHPDNGSGLDYLANAGSSGNWWAVVTDDGRPSGNPVIQGSADPAPGFYVSTTSLEDPSKARTDPRRYVDSSTVPYIVFPGRFGSGSVRPKLGDLAAVYYERTQKVAFAVFADIGPPTKLGEGSIALADRLGIPSNPKSGGGTSSGVLTIVFPGSGTAWPITEEEISRAARAYLDKWGGLNRLKREMPTESLEE
jgi:hypothetical protein